MQIKSDYLLSNSYCAFFGIFSNNRFLSYSLVRVERNEQDMDFIDIRCARNWLDGYNNKGDVVDLDNREIVINSYGFQ